MKRKYHKAKPGEKIILTLDQGRCVWTIQCCDCGLEHVIIMQPVKNEIHIGCWRLDDIGNVILPREHDKHKLTRPNNKSHRQPDATRTWDYLTLAD